MSTVALYSCATVSNLPPSGPTEIEIPQADRIIITPKDSSDLYLTVGQYLSDSGFSIKNSDKSLGNIQTEFKSFRRGAFRVINVRIAASIRDNEIHFYGFGGTEILGEFVAENKGSNNSEAQLVWDKVKEIALGFPHEEVLYSRN